MTTLQFDEWQDNGGTPVLRINAGALEVWDGAAWTSPGVGTLEASGGTEVTSGGYKYHTFTSSGSLTVSKAGLCEVLVISGGGGGAQGGAGGRGGGGGGGGAPINFSGVYLSADSHTVTVGAGGAPGNYPTQAPSGNKSSIGVVEAPGGGGGGSRHVAGSGGACGGGSGDRGGPGTVLPGYGFVGGANISITNSGGGGGGWLDAGSPPVSGTGGAGGDGTNAYSVWATATSTGDAGYFCGGGGGGASNNGGAGGLGGGGVGGSNNGTDTDADVNTGGGGGGEENTTAGNGGSGLVIVRYAI